MKTLVIIPGWGGSQDTWQKFINLARREFEVVCVELACFGNEPCPDSIWGVEEYADFVKKKLTELAADPQNTVILGHSFGGQIAVQLAGNSPGICDKLILSGAAVFRKKISLTRLIFWPVAKLGNLVFSLPGLTWLKPLARKLLYRVADSPDYNETSGIKRKIFRRVSRQDVSAHLAKIQVPTLVVWGQQDEMVPLWQGREIAGLLPCAELKIVPGGRHGLHLQDPAGLLQIVRTFIKT